MRFTIDWFVFLWGDTINKGIESLHRGHIRIQVKAIRILIYWAHFLFHGANLWTLSVIYLQLTLHYLLHAGHSSFFRTWDCEQNLHLSSLSSLFFSSNEASVYSPCLGSSWKDHGPFGAPGGLFIFSTIRLEVSRRALRSTAYINTSLQVELSFLI